MYDNVEIIIPDKEGFMVKDKHGVDYLFVLYSDKPINDLMKHIKEIKNNQSDYIKGLKKNIWKSINFRYKFLLLIR